MSKVKELVYSKDLIIPNLFTAYSFRDLTILSGRIYKEISKPWYYIKPKIKYSYTISLISDPFCDGEYATNRTLKTYAKELEQILIDKIQELSNEQNF